MSSTPYYHAVAFISDIHGNFEALEAVLEDIQRQNVSTIYCLGDLVGYGPSPKECVDKIIELTKSKKLKITVCGNHDYGLSNNNFTSFSKSAKQSNEWSLLEMKNTKALDYLREICDAPFVQLDGRFCLVHSSLKPAPKLWEYLKIKNAVENFIERKIVFVGHSHIPAIYSKYSSGKGWNPIDLFGNVGNYYLPQTNYEMLEAGKSSKLYRVQLGQFPTMIVNVGSVGQPRDENPNARYVLHLTIDYNEYIEYRQVGYDIQKTVAKHRERGLECDKRLAVRLITGGGGLFDDNHPKPDWFPF